ncbi:MAG: PqqD family protein [Candidatus Binataceae bacterium]
MSEKYISPSRNTPARMLGGEMIVMSVSDSTLFNLNPTASVLWRAADGTTPLSEIVRRHIVPDFEVEFDDAYRDALAFVEELAHHGILRITDEPVRQEQS